MSDELHNGEYRGTFQRSENQITSSGPQQGALDRGGGGEAAQTCTFSLINGILARQSSYLVRLVRGVGGWRGMGAGRGLIGVGSSISKVNGWCGEMENDEEACDLIEIVYTSL